jgi:hypothetical protein
MEVGDGVITAPTPVNDPVVKVTAIEAVKPEPSVAVKVMVALCVPEDNRPAAPPVRMKRLVGVVSPVSESVEAWALMVSHAGSVAA